ncbi:MAG TPA: hypothetical protein VOA41_07335 [Candidatus Dormibacteraeota bacterium]|nr:hypothetical protein [Candidatus Dormibacteraeota bacterium]
MKHSQRLLVASAVLVGIAAILVKAQNLPPNFGTPQGTNALAGSAGFVDILGIKLGMPAEEALGLLKSSYPASKITLQRTGDYEALWHTVERENPNHKWVFEIDVTPKASGDNVTVTLSLPPSKQVVTSVGRSTFFKEPVAVENIVAGLRKKYGQETYGLDYRVGGIVAVFDGVEKQFFWVYDVQGNRVKPDGVTANASLCTLNPPPVSSNLPPTLGGPLNEIKTLSGAPCLSWVILNAKIFMEAPSQGITGKATGFSVVAVDWPLVTSGAHALYAFLDQGARDVAAKQAADAKKRGGDVKY